MKAKLQSMSLAAVGGACLACFVAVVVLPFSPPVANAIFLVAVGVGVVGLAVGSWFE